MTNRSQRKKSNRKGSACGCRWARLKVGNFENAPSMVCREDRARCLQREGERPREPRNGGKGNSTCGETRCRDTKHDPLRDGVNVKHSHAVAARLTGTFALPTKSPHHRFLPMTISRNPTTFDQPCRWSRHPKDWHPPFGLSSRSKASGTSTGLSPWPRTRPSYLPEAAPRNSPCPRGNRSRSAHSAAPDA